MSADATGWVYRHSPYSGATFSVHLAIADSANDQNGNEFWMAQETLGNKARCTNRSARDALDRLVADGYLQELEGTVAPKGGRAVRRFRFLFVADARVVYESRWLPSNRKPLPQPPSRGTGSQSAANGKPDAEVTEASSYKPKGTQVDQPNTNQEPLAQGCALAVVDRTPSITDKTHPEYGFERFWQRYPRRDGKRDHKMKALNVWKRLSYDDKALAYRGLDHYNDACAKGLRIAMDANRYLAEREWGNWQTPAVPDAHVEPQRLQGTDRAKPAAEAYLNGRAARK